ncbi:MAG: hypothetical protein AAF490_12305 [Chloroflexota bacterium]
MELRIEATTTVQLEPISANHGHAMLMSKIGRISLIVSSRHAAKTSPPIAPNSPQRGFSFERANNPNSKPTVIPAIPSTSLMTLLVVNEARYAMII